MTYVARPGAKTTEAARAPAGALNVPRRVESRCASRGAHTCTCLRFDSPDVRVSLSVEHLVPPRSLAAREEVARFADVQHDSTHYQEPRTGHSRPKIPQRQENQCGVCPFTCFAAQTRPRPRYAERLRGHGRQREP